MTSMMTARRGVMAKPTSVFTPASVSGLYAWYDASQLTGLADGDPVATWTDLAGSARHATQATSTKRPVYKTGIQNGKPVLRFDGVDDYLQASSVNIAQPDTIFLVAKGSGASSTNFLDGNTNRQTYANDTTKFSMSAGGTVFSTANKDALWHQHSLVFNGASSGIWIDGAANGTGNPGGSALSVLNVATYNTAGAFLAGDMAELLIYSGALSTTDRQSVEAYLKSKWGTP